MEGTPLAAHSLESIAPPERPPCPQSDQATVANLWSLMRAQSQVFEAIAWSLMLGMRLVRHRLLRDARPHQYRAARRVVESACRSPFSSRAILSWCGTKILPSS